MIDINQVKADAEKEVREEQAGKAKNEIKSILRRLSAAKQAVANIERELADAYAELGKSCT